MSKPSAPKRQKRNTDSGAELPVTADRMVDKPPLNVKIFNDPIHGSIEIHPLCVKIIDTPQFQRLRHIKQLGACYHVYPGATHNRFEHSIGVGYLAGEMMNNLMRRQPELKITEVDKLCVTIAGLCHDLGHGPFSHMFDQQFLPMIEPKTSWTHELASIKMFDHLYDVNELKKEFLKHGFSEDDLQKDLVLIKELIHGPLPDAEDKLTGRPEKPYLYEIVSNKRNSVDVDKWDYLARDCMMLGIKSNFDHMRSIKLCKVIGDGNGSGIQQLCFRDKEVGNFYEMFHIRNAIHRNACKHAVTLAVDIMYAEALVLANEKIPCYGSNGECKISECKDDVVAYTKLTDNIFETILLSADAVEGKALLERVNKRQLYKCIGQAIAPAKKVKKRMKLIKSQEGDNICQTNKHVLIKKFEKQILGEICEYDSSLTAEEVLVKYVDFDYGMRDKNPVDNMRFFSKFNPDVSKKIENIEISELLPKMFEDHWINLYYKRIDMTPERMNQAKDAFRKWSKFAKCTMKEDRYGA